MRVYSPSAEVQGHGPGQEVLQTGKRDVEVAALEPIGNYAVLPRFSDGHDTGIFTWEYLYFLGSQQDDAVAAVRGAARQGRRRSRRADGRRGRRRIVVRPFALGRCPTSMSDTHFGFSTVDDSVKAERVRGVFDSVAPKYDVMNDLMSLGLHRAWKAYAVAVAGPRAGDKVLDLAGGTGDLARAFAKPVGRARAGRPHRHQRGDAAPGPRPPARRRHRPADARSATPNRCRSRAASFDLVSVAFGLRNMTHKDKALAEMARVLKNGGRLLVLEFSKVAAPLARAYDWYSFNVLPRIGQWVAGDGASYRYLAESIRVHPDQATLKAMMKSAGFGHVDVHNLSAGVVALHVGIKC